jgi:hypothetical protein
VCTTIENGKLSPVNSNYCSFDRNHGQVKICRLKQHHCHNIITGHHHLLDTTIDIIIIS